QAEDGIRDFHVTGVQTCALPIFLCLLSYLRFLQVIESWMRLLEVMFPSIANLTSIGKSYERRHIYALRVGAGSKASDSSNPRKRSEERRVGKECRARWWTDDRVV